MNKKKMLGRALPSIFLCQYLIKRFYGIGGMPGSCKVNLRTYFRNNTIGKADRTVIGLCTGDI